MTSNQIKEWIFNTIIEKAWFDVKRSDDPDTRRIRRYIKNNAFIVTVQLRSYGDLQNIIDAQRRVDKAFGCYHASILRPQCFNNGKVTRWNKKLQPLAFIAFDMEGSRQNSFHTTTFYPHGHGAVLFHEKTLANFQASHRRFLTPDGGYKVLNPTADISLVDFKPVNSLRDLDQFLGYSLKLESHLRSNQTNYAPFNFFPASSIYFPFWNRFPHKDVFAGQEGQSSIRPPISLPQSPGKEGLELAI
ncbi:hypothetical protein [Rhizobium sp. UGM030330-04]|uniref:hypothetical protein n=1 Tax=Rhizobium sp. UGM030330-04 TaxID=1378077 RepID=UPI000D8E710F|nr:hypothetical protein [Rhizobium sp. UGM030330-04]PYG55236.1 hypothetical protein N434_04284 [Rhizobium sp. UGM030330-04]